MYSERLEGMAGAGRPSSLLAATFQSQALQSPAISIADYAAAISFTVIVSWVSRRRLDLARCVSYVDSNFARGLIPWSTTTAQRHSNRKKLWKREIGDWRYIYVSHAGTPQLDCLGFDANASTLLSGGKVRCNLGR
jgi:hypothetical protein